MDGKSAHRSTLPDDVMVKLLSRIRDALIHARIRRFEQIQGWLTKADAVCLYRLARDLPPESKAVEIGSWKGKSTYCLARGVRSGRVIAIDPFNAAGEPGSAEIYSDAGKENLYESFCSRMASLGVADKIEVRRGTSREFAGQINDIDLLFIDGDHSIDGCRFDYEHYACELKTGGYLLFHDYQPGRDDFGPTWVVDNLVVPSGSYEQLGIAGSIWFGRRLE